MLVWKGALRGTPWPGHGVAELHLELWGTTRRSALVSASALEFSTFVRPKAVPLPALLGPAMTLYSKDEKTIAFFGELAASELGIVARLLYENAADEKPDKRAFDELFIECVRDPDNVIRVRPFNASEFGRESSHYSKDGSPVGAPSKARVPSVTHRDIRGASTGLHLPAKSSPRQAASTQNSLIAAEILPSVPMPTSTVPAAPVTTASAPTASVPTGIKGPARMLQQVILGALRLRGVKSSHPEYKQLYHLCYRAAEFALRRHSSPISMEVMKEKVEVILGVLEP